MCKPVKSRTTCRPPEARNDCRYFVVIDLAGFQVESAPAERGAAATLAHGGRKWRVGFADGRDGIPAEGLNVDGGFFAGCWYDGQLSKYLAGDVASVWLDGELYLVSDRPVDIAASRSGEDLGLKLAARDRAWIRFRCAAPVRLLMNGQAGAFRYDEAKRRKPLTRLPLDSARAAIGAAGRHDSSGAGALLSGCLYSSRRRAGQADHHRRRLKGSRARLDQQPHLPGSSRLHQLDWLHH